jgi:hypothetical protein
MWMVPDGPSVEELRFIVVRCPRRISYSSSSALFSNLRVQNIMSAARSGTGPGCADAGRAECL